LCRSPRTGEEGEARKAIMAIFDAMPMAKHVYVVDQDIDVTDGAEMEWAMSGRFQADKDLIVLSDRPGFFMDISANEDGQTAKAGFDCTRPFGQRDAVIYRRCSAPVFEGRPRYQTVRHALEEAGPMFFTHLMTAVGSDDGRDVTLALDELRNEGVLIRLEDGEYALYNSADPALTREPGDAIKVTGLATPEYGRR
jgi:3-polyprenyl-4-hydroxybenzoate decarboxylase